MTVVINGTTGISGVDGSAGTPAVQGTDANTGVFYPAADTVGVSTGGSERMRVDTSGNVGIGTSSPSSWGRFVSSGASPQVVAAGTSTNGGQVSIFSNGATTTPFQIGQGYATGTDNVAYISQQANQPLIFRTNATEQMRIDSSGNLQFNSGYGSVATAYGCRAWVNFNGTGTVAIRASGNVTSITDNGTGDYTVNFTNAMPDVNYSIVGSSGSGNTYGSYAFNNPGAGSRFAVGSCRINSFITQSAGLADVDTVCVSVFR